MPKLIALVTRPAEAERGAFLSSTCSETERRLRGVDGAASLVVSLVDVAPPDGSADAVPPYDAVIEAGLEDDSQVGAAAALLTDGWRAYVYQVVERVQLTHQRTWELGERSPGVKAIYLVRRLASLSAREAGRRWREHAPLARTHHTGMSRYLQNGVLASLTPEAPVVDGIAMLHFPTRADLEQRLYGSAAGRALIAADAARLVGESTALYASEYILRD